MSRVNWRSLQTKLDRSPKLSNKDYKKALRAYRHSCGNPEYRRRCPVPWSLGLLWHFFGCYSNCQKTTPFLTREVDLKGRPVEERKESDISTFLWILCIYSRNDSNKDWPRLYVWCKQQPEKLSSTGTQNWLRVHVKKTEVTRNQKTVNWTVFCTQI